MNSIVAVKESENRNESDDPNDSEKVAGRELRYSFDPVKGREPAKLSEGFGVRGTRRESDGVNNGVSLKTRVGGRNRESWNGAEGLIGFVRVNRSVVSKAEDGVRGEVMENRGDGLKDSV